MVLLERAAEEFAAGAGKRYTVQDLKSPHARIGQLKLETDSLADAFAPIGDVFAK